MPRKGAMMRDDELKGVFRELLGAAADPYPFQRSFQLLVCVWLA